MTVELIFLKHPDSVTTFGANRGRLHEAYLRFGKSFLSYPVDQTTTVRTIRRAAAKHFRVTPDHIALRIKSEEDLSSDRNEARILPLLKKETQICVDIKKCGDIEHCPKTIELELNFYFGHERLLMYVTVNPGMKLQDLRQVVCERTGVTPDVIPTYTDEVDSLPDEIKVKVDTTCTLL